MFETVTDARTQIMEHLDEGRICPVCDQNARRWRRSLTSGMVRALMVLRRHYGEPALRTLAEHRLPSGDYAKLRFWGLLVPDPSKDADGVWIVTRDGREFLDGQLRVQRYAHVYNNAVERYSGPMVCADECLRSPFDLEQLLAYRGRDWREE